MALKAGRVGVNPADVDPIDGHINPSAMSGYTKQEADAKFQPMTLAVPVKYLNGSQVGLFETVQDALSGSYGENGAMTNKDLTDKVHGLLRRVAYKSTDAGRTDITVAAGGSADISIPSISGYSILTRNITLTGSGSTLYASVSVTGGVETVTIINNDSQSHTWGYDIKVYYIPTDIIDVVS